MYVFVKLVVGTSYIVWPESSKTRLIKNKKTQNKTFIISGILYGLLPLQLNVQIVSTTFFKDFFQFIRHSVLNVSYTIITLIFHLKFNFWKRAKSGKYGKQLSTGTRFFLLETAVQFQPHGRANYLLFSLFKKKTHQILLRN